MEATALYITTLSCVLMLAAATGQNIYAQSDVFPRVVPNRLQFFQYEPVSIHCEEFEGPTQWRVMRKLKEAPPTNASSWGTTTRTRIIKAAYSTDSGEYWCEDEEGKRSNAVHISVTAGAVILDIPAVPVNEGDHVSLRCQKGKTSNVTAQFYKDGFIISTGYNGELTIASVSMSDEGLYKCSMSGDGESAESWLTVRAHEEQISALLWIHVSVFCVAQLLMVVGLLHHRKLTESGGTKSLLPEERLNYSSVQYRSVTAETLGDGVFKALKM